MKYVPFQNIVSHMHGPSEQFDWLISEKHNFGNKTKISGSSLPNEMELDSPVPKIRYLKSTNNFWHQAKIILSSLQSQNKGNKKLQNGLHTTICNDWLNVLDFPRNVILVYDWFLEEHVQRALILSEGVTSDSAKNNWHQMKHSSMKS